MKEFLVQFIPIILIFLILTYTENMIKWSNAGLGKLMIIIIILFYASIDKLYGVLVCLLFILFFQSDTVETMLNKEKEKERKKQEEEKENFEPIEDKSIKHNRIKPMEQTSYSKQYDLPKITSEVVKNDFRQKYCEKGHLVNKGQKIKIDMTEHVYPEVNYTNDKCNICYSECDFTIIENQLNISERMVPKSCR